MEVRGQGKRQNGKGKRNGHGRDGNLGVEGRLSGGDGQWVARRTGLPQGTAAVRLFDSSPVRLFAPVRHDA
jgi:hypothetical protein